MKSPEWTVRSEALDKAAALLASGKLNPPDDDRLRLGIIQLLVAENARLNAANNGAMQASNNVSGTDEGEGEDESEYYAGLISSVADMNDERAIPALVGAMTTGGMAQRGLMKYGDKALEPVLQELKNPDALVRATALGMSIKMLEKRNDPTSHSRTRELVRSSLADPSLVVRGHAVKEVDCLEDRQDFVPVLEQIAKTDPDKLSGKALDGGDGEQFYPVRYDARRVLRDIRDNQTCSP
jgi:hypothetical protein